MLKFLKILIVLCGYLNVQSAIATSRLVQNVTNNGVVYCTNANGFSLNPQTADASTSMNVVTEQIYNKLFEAKNNSAEVEPSLAESYQISQNGKVITIRLRKGIQFHHTPWFTPTRELNADDVVFSLNRVLGHHKILTEPTNQNEQSINQQYQIYYDLARKARFPYFESVKLNQKIQKVESLDSHTVQITLFEPDASFLSHLASQYAVILSQEYALQLNAKHNLIQLDELPVGTGAYQVKNYFRSQYIRLTHNPHYWQKTPMISQVVIDLSTDRTSRLAKFLNGECQIAAFPELSQLGLLKKSDSQFQTTITKGMNLSFLAFNFLRPTMQNIDIRRAIAQAINRQRIINLIYYNTATVANHIIPSISWAANNHQANFEYDYAPEQAKAKLKNLNLNLDLWVVDEDQLYNPAPIKMAEIIKFDLAQAGVKVNVRLVSRNFLIKNLTNKSEDYDLILDGWLTGSLDPDSFLRPILGCNATSEITNLSNWCSPKFDQLLDLALSENNVELRSVAYHQSQQLAISQLAILPIANVNRLLISNSKVKGIEMTPFGNIHFEKLFFEQRQHQ